MTVIQFRYRPCKVAEELQSSATDDVSSPCVGLNWLLVSFLSHVNKNIIHSFIHSGVHPVRFLISQLLDCSGQVECDADTISRTNRSSCYNLGHTFGDSINRSGDLDR